jgi:two-component system, NtrC family, sensor kinase
VLVLTVLQGPDKGRRFELPDHEPQLIGRSSEALPLNDQTISRRHAELTPDTGRWFLNDLASSNGTFVNGQRVRGRRLLEIGDQIRTGLTIFLYGKEPGRIRGRHGVRVGRADEIHALVEGTAAANDDSMIMAVPEPSEAAVLQLRVVYEMTELVGSTMDKQALLEKVMDLIFDHFEADRGFILLQDNPDERPEPTVVRHRVEPPKAKPAQITLSRTIVQHVLRQGEGVLSSNAMSDHRFAGGDSVQNIGIRSAMCVPIKYKERIFGVIHIDSRIANYTFTEDQLRLFTAIGVHAGLALANAELYARRLHHERLAAVGQTVASLSHSIKNILQGMRGGADVVELGLKKDDMKVIRGGWPIVSRNLERIYNLTMNMLAYSKQRKPELEMVNAPMLVNEIVGMMQSQYDAARVALITDIDSDMPPVPMDASGIHQAVLNLLSNALDAVKPDVGAVTLTCDYVPETNRVCIQVTDNGMGISPVQRKYLFQPFHSTKGLKGTGLGLVVTKKIVEEHGGTLRLESRTGKGTTVRLELPTSTSAFPALADTHGDVGDVPSVVELPPDDQLRL